jgi:hypothetical protein
MDTRELLEKQIIEDSKNGDTTVLAEILSQLPDEVVFGSLSDKNQELSKYEVLKGGDNITALVDLQGVSTSFNTPELIKIPKGTILQVPHQGTSRGDVFCTIADGKATLISRARGSEGEEIELKRFAKVGLRMGHKTRCPYDLGMVETSKWKISRF